MLHSAHKKSDKWTACETTEISDHENSKLNCRITNKLLISI